MRTRRASVGAPAKQKSCDLNDSFDGGAGNACFMCMAMETTDPFIGTERLCVKQIRAWTTNICGCAHTLPSLEYMFDYHQENVDVNIQPRTRGRRGLAEATKRKKPQPEQSNEANDRASKRRKRAVATPENTTRAKGTQGAPRNSNCPATSQETPPAFTFTKGKQTFRKRKLLKEKQKSQQCDQKRIEDLVQYFKGLDDQKLKFA